MTKPAFIVSVPVLACVLASSGLARAEGSAPPSTSGSPPGSGDPTKDGAHSARAGMQRATPQPPRVGLLATGALGGVGYDSPEASSGGLVASGQVLARWHYLAVGVGAEEQGSLAVGATQVHAVGGLSLYFAGRVRLDALGLLGTHHYSSWKGNTTFFSDDPGASGDLPVAGGRATLAYEPYTRPGPHFFGSVTAGYQDDLGREHVSYDYAETGWLSGASSTETADHTLGAGMLYVGLGVGVEFDVSPDRASR